MGQVVIVVSDELCQLGSSLSVTIRSSRYSARIVRTIRSAMELAFGYRNPFMRVRRPQDLYSTKSSRLVSRSKLFRPEGFEDCIEPKATQGAPISP